MDILLATNNAHKIGEIRDILGFKYNKVLSLSDINLKIDVEENGDTYYANAKIKALAVYKKIKDYIIIADDSGLEISYLNGEPGLKSARYFGDIPQTEKNKKIVEKMKDLPIEQRVAKFRAVLCMILPDGENHFFEGVCPGHISEKILGEKGFGYDPIFIPTGFLRSLGELSSDIKNLISHRAKSFQLAKSFLVYSGLLK